MSLCYVANKIWRCYSLTSIVPSKSCDFVHHQRRNFFVSRKASKNLRIHPSNCDSSIYGPTYTVCLDSWRFSLAATVSICGPFPILFGDRCFAAAAPRLWNSLPINLRQCHSLEQFKRLLKTFLCSAWGHGTLWHLLKFAPFINLLTYLLKPARDSCGHSLLRRHRDQYLQHSRWGNFPQCWYAGVDS